MNVLNIRFAAYPQQTSIKKTANTPTPVTFGNSSKPKNVPLVLGLLLGLAGIFWSLGGAHQASMKYDQVANVVPVDAEEKYKMQLAAIPGALTAGIGGILLSIGVGKNKG